MADGGFDPCQCIFSHEFALRRLISLLRNSQSYCTDTECYQEMPGPRPDTSGGDSTFLLFTVAWVLLAALLYMMRPSALRRRGDEKSNGNQGPSGGNPPPDAPVH